MGNKLKLDVDEPGSETYFCAKESHLKTDEKILKHWRRHGTQSYSVQQETVWFGAHNDVDYDGYKVNEKSTTWVVDISLMGNLKSRLSCSFNN